MTIVLDLVLLDQDIWCDRCEDHSRIRYGTYRLKPDEVVNLGARLVCTVCQKGEPG